MWCYIEDMINHVHAAEPQYSKLSNIIKSLDEYNNILHSRNSKVYRKEPWYNKPHNSKFILPLPLALGLYYIKVPLYISEFHANFLL